MPRIDPNQLLQCLKPLLAEHGGIKSQAEVNRIASLMEKYSKKLVSKCIYIQILKCTEAELLGQFMTAGGWNLVHQWLKDGSDSKNWPFVQEIMEMFLACPVDSNRLKSNHTPKIVKELSENSSSAHVKLLATKLVQQWLKIAYHEKRAQSNEHNNGVTDSIDNKPHSVDNKNVIKSENEVNQTSEGVTKYKISNKEGNGKLLLSLKRSTSPSADVKDPKILKISSNDTKDTEKKVKDEKKDKKSSSSSSHKSSSSKSSHRDKDRSSSHKSSSSSSSKDKHHKSSSKSSSSSSSRDKSKDKEKDREKRKKEEKEKAEKAQAEKDKETLNFLQPLPSAKLQRIPKRQPSENGENKSSESNSAKTEVEKKKPSISIEVRTGEKPKTVKTLNSQFRDHGLAAEAPKPPSRKDIKKPGATVAPIAPISVVPVVKTAVALSLSPTISKKEKLEKAMETDDLPERVGGVKIIKPKPMIYESIGFMDALDASTTVKKDTKKRKRLPSGSGSGKKDELESPKIDQKPLKFYQDTLEGGEEEMTNGETSPTKELDTSAMIEESMAVAKENGNGISSPSKDEDILNEIVEEKEPEIIVRAPGIGCGPDGPPGVLVNPALQRKKKRPVRWREGDELTEVRFFELDENERCNVTKTFSEQQHSEHENERNAFDRGRKLQDNDVMTEQMPWRNLIIVENYVPAYEYKGVEAGIQAERERNVLQDIFFPHQSINDSPLEPTHEIYEHVEPQIIPAEDINGSADSIMNHTEIRWPAPRGDIISTIQPSTAFGNVFNNIPSSLNIPPNIALNPLNFPMSGIAAREQPGQMWMVPPAPFLNQPPPNLLANQGVNRGNFNNYNNNNNNRSNNNNSRGGNWVRGNAGRGRGVCNQFKRNGNCRNQKCPYIHER